MNRREPEHQVCDFMLSEIVSGCLLKVGLVCSTVAEFYEEMTKVESLNPLRTLHNAVPLKEMDNFFDKATGPNIEAVVTPFNTPSRKAPSKKLSRPSSNRTQLLEKMGSRTNEDVEEIVTDLLAEASQKLDSR